MAIVFLNGSFLEEEKAFISVSDRGFLFGDGVFTTMKVVDGETEFLHAHLERLYKHCFVLEIIPPRIMPEWIEELIHRCQAKKGTWRLKIVITGGENKVLSLEKRDHGSLLMTLSPLSENSRKESRLMLFPFPMIKPSSQIKSLAYLDRLWTKQAALQQGYDDVIVTTSDGVLLESAFSNLFWRRGREIFTPDPSLPLLFGVTIAQLTGMAEKEGMSIKYVKHCLDEIPANSQMYLCNALHHCSPIVSIDQRIFLRDLYFEEELKRLILLAKVSLPK